MTVTAAVPMWSKEDVVKESPDGRNRRITIRRGYSVTCDPTDDTTEILGAPNLPQEGDLYPNSVQVRVKRVSPSRVSPVYAVVMVEWAGEVGPSGILNDNPINTVPTVRWRNLVTQEEIDEDINGEAIATVNGERVRGIYERVVDWVAVIERNYAYGAFNLHGLHQYLRSVNSDTIRTGLGDFPPGTGSLTKFEPTEIVANEIGGYVKVNAEITFRYPYKTIPARAWWKRYLHEGYKIKTTDGRIINALDGNNDRQVSPILLDSTGLAVEDPANAFYREQQTLFSLPYATLGLL